jgi:hypothetical protein
MSMPLLRSQRVVNNPSVQDNIDVILDTVENYENDKWQPASFGHAECCLYTLSQLQHLAWERRKACANQMASSAMLEASLQ